MSKQAPDLSHIAEDLRPLAAAIEQFNPDPQNARTDHDIDGLVASLEAYGQRRPLVVNRQEGNKVEAGNGMLKAAKRLGWEYIAVIFVDDDPDTAAGFGLADNALGDNSRWELGNLRTLTDSLKGKTVFTGLKQADLSALLPQIKTAPPEGSPPVPLKATHLQKRQEMAKKAREKWGVRSGQVWEVPAHDDRPPHFLYCGDCTDLPAQVLEGVTVDAIVTDPPYCSGGFQEAGKREGSAGVHSMEPITRDRLSTRGYIALMTNMLRVTPVNLVYIFVDWRMWVYLYDIVESVGYTVRSMIVWDKQYLGLGHGWRPQHEIILCGVGSAGIFGLQEGRGNVISHPRTGNHYHVTEKPVGVIEELIKPAPKMQTYYDPFLGSGPSLIGAERMGKRLIGVELVPANIALALDRYFDEFGIKGKLIGEL